MKKNENNCSAYVTFKRGVEVKTVELCSLEEAAKYIVDVVIKNDWKFIGLQRGMEYKVTLTTEQQEVFDQLKKDADFYGEDGQFTIEASHFRFSFKFVQETVKELAALGLITLFPKKSCYFDGQINNF